MGLKPGGTKTSETPKKLNYFDLLTINDEAK